MGNYYQGSSKELIINQLRDSSNYVEMIRLMAEDFDDISDLYDYIGNITVYNATGKWLDLIGNIVGVSRQINVIIISTWFGFNDQPNVAGFGQAPMYDGSVPLTGSSMLTDGDYRRVILAKVAKNFGDVSETGIVTAIQNIVNINDVTIQSMGNASFRIYIGGVLDENTRNLFSSVDIIPRAAGVKLDGLYYRPRPQTFGFADQGLQGFGVGSFVEEIS